MKRFLSIILSVLALTSCATAFQQIATISSPQIKLTDSGRYAYQTEDIVVDYNFWAENGQVSFVVTNNLDTDVYVDLGRSFLVVNGMTFDYFQNRTYSTNSSSTTVSSSSYGASNTFGVANGIANSSASSYGNYASATSVGHASGSSYTSGYTRRITSSSTVNKGLEYKEKEGVWIPAHSSRHFSEFSLLEAPYRECGLARNPSRKEDMTAKFTKYNTPYTFDNVLMLVINGVDKRLVNTFFIESIKNIQYDETYTIDSRTNCDGSKSSLKYRYPIYTAANRFYINYEFNKRNDQDTDRVKGGRTAYTNQPTTKVKSKRSFADGVYNR